MSKEDIKAREISRKSFINFFDTLPRIFMVLSTNKMIYNNKIINTKK